MKRGMTVGGAAAAPPPPLPANGMPPAAASAPAPPPSGAPCPRREQPTHPDGFPPEKDLGALGKSLIWMLGMVLFGGGLAGWFFLVGYVEQNVDELLILAGDGGIGAESVNPMAATSLGGGDADDLAFVSQQFGIQAQMLGLQPDAEAPIPSIPAADRREDWPDLHVAGVMKGARPSDARVMLNGVLVRVGDFYRDVQVVEIKDQAAALRFKDEVIWLYSGQTTAD